MKKWAKFFIIIVALGLIAGAGWYVYYREYNEKLSSDIAAAAVDEKGLRPYILGTPIVFARDGNSNDYIQKSNGWGGQEPEHRCMQGSTTILNLYVPDSVGANLRLTVDGFGVYDPADGYQTIDVYANDTHLITWRVANDGPFMADIPNTVVTDGTLILRFEIAKPYTPPVDTRKLGMAVREIVIDRVFGAQTKRKIGIWVKNNIMGGGAKQVYDTETYDDVEMLD